MQFRFVVVLLVAALIGGCQTEIDEKPAAQVGEATTTELTATQTPTSVANVIKERSKIGFIGAKVTGQHVGQFNEFDGRIEYVGSQPAAINFTINLDSVKTDAAKLDTHLKSADFFDVQRFPTATFVSKSIQPASGDPNASHSISGTLTLHGVSKDVTFPAKVEVSPQGVHAASEFKINRHDWGISYRGAADDLIRDDVAILLDLWFPPPPAA